MAFVLLTQIHLLTLAKNCKRLISISIEASFYVSKGHIQASECQSYICREVCHFYYATLVLNALVIDNINSKLRCSLFPSLL